MSYKPPLPFNVPAKILVPGLKNEYGVNHKTFENGANVSDDYLIYVAFRSFGGTETIVNGVHTLLDTAVIDCWYDPRIKASCRLYMCETGDVYEVIGDPENISMQNTYLKFKVQKIGGAV